MPVLNRRDLVRNSTLLAVGGLISARAQEVTAPHTPPKKVSYAPVDVATFHGAGTIHASAAANLLRGNATAQDYKNVASALATLRTNWVAAGLDSMLVPQFNTVNERDLTVAKMGSQVAWATNNIKSFNPAVTETQIAVYLNYMLANTVINGVDYKTTTLQKMRTGGTSTLLQAGVDYYNGLAPLIPVPKMNATTHKYAAQLMTLPPEGGGGGEPAGCFYLGGTATALALVGVTLAVMTDGLSLLAEGAFEAVAYWAGIDSAGLATEHALRC